MSTTNTMPATNETNKSAAYRSEQSEKSKGEQSEQSQKSKGEKSEQNEKNEQSEQSEKSKNAGEIALGRYLWERIHQVGVNQVFGVPGDFNLTLLDHLYHVDGLEWIGNTNELNAAYAADGYARVRNGAGCLVTTHGVGELSAINAVAGSMSEHIKIIHVVGQTSVRMQNRHMMIHHSIGDVPDHHMYSRASRDFRVAAAELQTAVGAAEEIDRVLRECFVRSGPVYLFVPIDLVDVPVSADPLRTPVDQEPHADPPAVEKATRVVWDALRASTNPCVLVDCLVQRHNAADEARSLLHHLPLPIYTTNMGKGIIDETHDRYVGLYNGDPSGTGVQDAFETHDFILCLGSLASDTNAGGFTRRTPSDSTAFLDPHSVRLPGGETTAATPIAAVLRSLTLLASSPSCTLPQWPSNPRHALPPRPREHDADSPLITQSWVWHRLAAWLRPHDVLLGETGTAAFGIPDATFPAAVTWISQTYYGSIGYSTPAALGVECGRADDHARRGVPRGRTLLCTGDGSLMLTVQEIGNMVRRRLRTVVFIINNAGYTIERVIHGAQQSYNDVVPFNYAHMLPFLGNADGGGGDGGGCVGPATFADDHDDDDTSTAAFAASYHRASTKAELDALLARDDLCNPRRVHVVELVMHKLDVPWRLATQVAARGPEAVREMRAAGFQVREMKTSSNFWN